MVTIYKKLNFKIYSNNKKGYIIHNTRLNFDNHHTHINNYNTCKFIINLCIHKTVPDHLSDYLLVSILRLTDDQNYKNKIHKLLEKSNEGKNKAYNNSNNIPKIIDRSKSKKTRKVNKYGKKNNESRKT
jgi:hypothetical protein